MSQAEDRGSDTTLDALFAASLPAAPATPPPAVASEPEEDSRLCALVARVSRCEQKALAELYDATVSRVYGLARGITRNLQCAEEVTEDVYWQVWRQALRFDRRRGPVMAWLLTLARSRALDHLRRRDPATGRAPPDAHEQESADPALDPSLSIAAAERDRRLLVALDQLEPLPRQLLSLAFYRGLTHDEIAQQTRLPLGTVKSQIRRALAALRGLLSPQAHEEVTS
ncbi:MAG TPA: sigma-70 family RNA polymerase sigma factor [Albitalea sp.]|nr:sigma-70 family RNA polymerase sigma factor [Albitalea sp.]